MNFDKRQNKSENIEQEIDTMGIIIYWKQWSWKTLMAINIAVNDWPKRIYSNFDIYKNWNLLNHRLEDVKEVEKVRFSFTPWVIMIDEAGINANSKDTRAEANRILQEVLFLVRKKNCSLIWISQRFESIDINARVLSELIIEMKKIRRYWRAPTFIATRQKQKGTRLEFVQQWRIDSIEMMRRGWLTYNTLEASKFKKINKKTKKEVEII